MDFSSIQQINRFLFNNQGIRMTSTIADKVACLTIYREQIGPIWLKHIVAIAVDNIDFSKIY